MARSLQVVTAARRPTVLQGRLGKYLFAAGLCGLFLLFLVDAFTISRQASWQDEIFVVSTGLSVARFQPPIQSVMAQYPRADSPIRFYGPVSFVADAELIRWFGLSITAWRLACLGGVVLTLIFSTMLVRFAGGDNWAQLVAALIIGLAGSFGSLPGPVGCRHLRTLSWSNPVLASGCSRSSPERPAGKLPWPAFSSA